MKTIETLGQGLFGRQFNCMKTHPLKTDKPKCRSVRQLTGTVTAGSPRRFAVIMNRIRFPESRSSHE